MWGSNVAVGVADIDSDWTVVATVDTAKFTAITDGEDDPFEYWFAPASTLDDVDQDAFSFFDSTSEDFNF